MNPLACRLPLDWLVWALILGCGLAATARADVFVANGTQGGPSPVNTAVSFTIGQPLTVCAEETVKLSIAGPSEGPDGTTITSPASYWLPSAPQASLVGKIGTTIFSLGRCFNGPAPGTGILEIGVNDDLLGYADNLDFFRVFVGGGGAPAQKLTTYTISGTSDTTPWTIGFEETGSGAPTSDTVTNAGLFPFGAPASAFSRRFFLDINGNQGGLADRCRCALPGDPGVGLPGTSIDYRYSNADCVAAGVPFPCCTAPANGVCVSATAPGAAETFHIVSEITTPQPGLALWIMPSCDVDVSGFTGCPFNPTIFAVAGAAAVPALPIAAKLALVLVGAAALFALARGRVRA